jgi:DNA polymerase
MAKSPKTGPRTFPSLHKKPTGDRSYCTGCVLEHSGHGFSHPRGPDTSPIAFMGEAPGPEELKAGVPFVGPAGSMHARLLRMIGKDQDRYKLFNTIACMPPFMELSATPYERQAIDQCRYREAVLANPHHQVIVTLGSVATRTLLGLGKGASIEDLHGTVHRVGERLVVPTYHPSHLQRGAHNLMGVVLFDLQRAEEVAAGGWADDPGVLVEDPPLDWFTAWVDMVVDSWQQQPGRFWLSCDIETPDKAGGKSEGELTPDDLSYVIERINWSCNTDEGITVPYVGGYIAQCDRLFLDWRRGGVAGSLDSFEQFRR